MDDNYIKTELHVKEVVDWVIMPALLEKLGIDSFMLPVDQPMQLFYILLGQLESLGLGWPLCLPNWLLAWLEDNREGWELGGWGIQEIIV